MWEGEGREELEGGARGLDFAEDFEALLVPAEVRGENGGEDDDEETVGEEDDPGVTRGEAGF